MDMKRYVLLVLLMTLIAGTTWGSVRLEWDDATGMGSGNSIAPIDHSLEGQTGGEASSLALGEASAEVRTPSFTFTLTSHPDTAAQTPSLVASLAASHDRSLTLETVTFEASASDLGGEVISLYEWDLDGDGIFDKATESDTLQHTFPDDGVVLAQVRITDEHGRMASSEVLQLEIVNRPPTARFKVDLDAVSEGSLIQFRNLSDDEDGTIASWLYSFGDGTTSTEANPSHAYTTAGIFQVTLTVTDEDGAQSDVFFMEVEISNLSPQADFSLQRSTLDANQPLLIVNQSIDPSTDGEIVHVAWDFGDGTYLAGAPSSDSTYSHVFSASGSYTVTLYLIDNAAPWIAPRQLSSFYSSRSQDSAGGPLLHSCSALDL
ncbi:PKD domain-containing protein [Candidatus Bipolaricaulota bacterium]